MPAAPDRNPLPFEPTRKQKKPQKAAASGASAPSPAPAKSQRSPKRSRYTREEVSVPEAVSRRMLRRMVFFSGVPVLVGILVFFGSYVIITQGIADLPNVVVLLSTLACFGLSVVGLTYGALSASWEEDSTGGVIGLSQFRLNASRMADSWRQAREERQSNAPDA